VELYRSVNESVERIVLTNANIVAWVVLRTALANNNVACNNFLATENLNAESL
jgi:hypothetical protein